MVFQEGENVSNKSEVERFRDELKSATITFENYKRYFDKINNTDQNIIIQIENISRNYTDLKKEFKEMTDRETFKQAESSGFIPTEVFQVARELNAEMLEAFTWKSIQSEMYNIVFKKIYHLLDETNALSIKGDALKEMRKDLDRQQDTNVKVLENMGKMFKETMMNKFELYDEKYVGTIKNLLDAHNNQMSLLLQLFETKLNVDFAETNEKDYYKKIMTPKIEQPIITKKEREEPVSFTKPIEKPKVEVDDEIKKISDEIYEGYELPASVDEQKAEYEKWKSELPSKEFERRARKRSLIIIDKMKKNKEKMMQEQSKEEYDDDDGDDEE